MSHILEVIGSQPHHLGDDTVVSLPVSFHGVQWLAPLTLGSKSEIFLFPSPVTLSRLKIPVYSHYLSVAAL